MAARDYQIIVGAIDRLAAYEDTGLTPEEVAGLCEMDKRSRMAKMLRWEEAEAAGRLMILPCKVGDEVWLLDNRFMQRDGSGFRFARCRINEFSADANNTYAVLDGDESWYAKKRFMAVPICDIGKTVFLSREAAEAALKGGEADA